MDRFLPSPGVGRRVKRKKTRLLREKISRSQAPLISLLRFLHPDSVSNPDFFEVLR